MAGRTLIPIGMADRDTCRHRYSRMAHCNVFQIDGTDPLVPDLITSLLRSLIVAETSNQQNLVAIS